MSAAEDFGKPAWGNSIDSDIDAIRGNFNFLLMVAAHGSIVVPGWQTTVTPDTSGATSDYSQPVTITLSRGTRRIYFHYTWASDGTVATIQMCYDDGVSSPGLTCFDAVSFFYDEDGNPTGTDLKTTAKDLGGTSVANYYTSSEGLINTSYQKMTLVWSFYGQTYSTVGSGYSLLYAANSVITAGYYNSSGQWVFNLKRTNTLTHSMASPSVSPQEMAIDSWHACMFSIDAVAGTAVMWVDGAEYATWSGFAGYTYYAMNAYGNMNIGKGNTHGCDCYLSQTWCDDDYFDPATYWSAFFDTNNKPKYLGADGSTPTGSQPLSFFPAGDPTNNLGSLSNWTEVGTVPDAPSSPTD